MTELDLGKSLYECFTELFNRVAIKIDENRDKLNVDCSKKIELTSKIIRLIQETIKEILDASNSDNIDKNNIFNSISERTFQDKVGEYLVYGKNGRPDRIFFHNLIDIYLNSANNLDTSTKEKIMKKIDDIMKSNEINVSVIKGKNVLIVCDYEQN